MNAINGTTQECLRDFFAKVFKLPENQQEKIASHLVSFMGVNGNIIQRWADGGSQPNGLSFIKVQCYLKNMGYDITEIQNIDPIVSRLAELIVFNKIELSKALEISKFSSVSELFRVLRGGRGISPERREIMKELCEPFKEVELEFTKPDFLNGNKDIILPDVSFDEKTEVILSSLFKALDSIENILVAELRFVLEDPVNREDRMELRKRIGSDFVFSLSNKTYTLMTFLNAFCSEKAREINLPQIKSEIKNNSIIGGSHEKE